MDYTDRDFVRNQLQRMGFSDVTDEMLDEFLAHLREDDDVSGSPQQSKKRSSPTKLSQSPKQQTKKNTTLSKQSPLKRSKQPDTDSEDDYDRIDDENEPPSAQPTRAGKQIQTRFSSSTAQKRTTSTNPVTSSSSTTKRKVPAQVDRDEEDDEILNWSRRLKAIQAKAQTLDTQIQECRSAIIDPPTEEANVPLHFGNSDRKQDPYPTVKRKMTGGFIRPPPVRQSRKAGGPKGRRLLYEERVPEYIPPPERRRDALRWQIRQKLIYSDPKYH